MNTSPRRLTLHFCLGWAACACSIAAFQDWMGKERYIQWLEASWVPLSPWVPTILGAAFITNHILGRQTSSNKAQPVRPLPPEPGLACPYCGAVPLKERTAMDEDPAGNLIAAVWAECEACGLTLEASEIPSANDQAQP